ncbi:negative regulator of sigma-X activity [Neobacillus sp. PS3-34]|uniref:negative regulator of sigma-X activity n=1 Tax=Neobacillus sp. PS3-34 TaxID=3070678 RepID=UPI0027DEFEF8|nr:negative regulator of sigma-X activity [Neobacillus sp. PS3-34]WML47664.1 negative regulator of sigma-X activity [Neobacillus sp. PS3-34]
MKKSEWSDKQLEDLLRQMPNIHDNRNPHDIYQSLSIKNRKRKHRSWLMPGLAAAAALLLMFILSPGLLNFENHKENKELADTSSKKMADSIENKSSENIVLKKSVGNQDKAMLARDTSKPAKLDESEGTTALYEEEAAKGKVLTYWIPDAQAVVLVPVSIVVKQDQSKSWLDMYNEHMAELKESQWGLSDYYPLNASLKLDENGNAVIVDVPANHQYGQGSTNETSFDDIIQNTVRSNSNIRNIRYTTENKQGIEFGNRGLISDEAVQDRNGSAYLFLVPDGKNVPFLVPTANSYPDIKAAFLAMQQDLPGLKASVSPDLHIETSSFEDKTLYISLGADSKLENNPESLYSFEAIMLTAKEFGAAKVKLVNAPIQNLGPFDLNTEIKVPVGANYRPSH